jgi:hypothetical protein
MLDFSKIKTYPIKQRRNLVTRSDFTPVKNDEELWVNAKVRDLVARIKWAREKDRPVIMQMGAHVVKSGLSLLVIDLMKRGIVTHVAGNGAVSIHDFEMALIGETSEDVGESITDGSFGMAEETGGMMNDAINASPELGYGAAVGKMILDHGLKHPKYSILAQGQKLGVPVTIHVAVGTDIIHQHPRCNGANLGEATFQDFKIYCESIARADDGVILNFGSAVIMPEVFLKALSITRNLGHAVRPITTANFEIRRGLSNWYYRPTKNVVNRPTQDGGKGFNFLVDHKVSIPSLHRLLTKGE